MANIRDLRPSVSSFITNLPDLVFVKAFREVARDYFRKTQAWQDKVDIGNVSPAILRNGQNTDVDAQTQVDAILYVECSANNSVLSPVKPPLKEDTGAEFAMYYYCPTNDKIVLYPTPSNAASYQATVALKPALDATTLDDSVYEANEEALRVGVIAHLMRQPNTDWYNPNDAAAFYREYELYVSDKKLEVSTGFNNSEESVIFPSFM